VLALLGVAVGIGLLVGLVTSRKTKRKRGADDVARRRDRLCAAMLNGDAKKAADFYAEHAHVVTRLGGIIEGRDMVAERTARDLAGGQFMRAEVSDVARFGDGDLVFESGAFGYGFLAADGQSRNVDGRYVAVWRYSADAWRIALESANLAQTPAQPNVPSANE